jgi:hypothetical protein
VNLGVHITAIASTRKTLPANKRWTVYDARGFSWATTSAFPKIVASVFTVVFSV